MQLDPKAQIPVLLYLFHRIEKRLDGRPTLITLDEAWAYLQHPVFAAKLKDWLKTIRRKNGVCFLLTQQMSDIAHSDIADVVIEQCPTKILLPNAEANTTGSATHPGPREFYERLGLNTREIEILQTAVRKRDYYVISPLGRRLIDLGLGPVALSFVGINGQEERGLLEKLIHKRPDTWREEWLRLRGLPSWADYLQSIQLHKEEKSQCSEIELIERLQPQL
jgi:type IV secretion system protein VirB4